MKSIILYGSEYGFTKKYALELARLTGLDAYSFNRSPSLAEYQLIVYMGGLYAGGVKGLKETEFPLGAKLFLATVGLSDPRDKDNTAHISSSVQTQLPAAVYDRTTLFHLRGGIDYKRLRLKHKAMMSALCLALKARPAEKRSADDQGIIDTYGKAVDFTDLAALAPIAEAVRQAVQS